MDVNRVLIEYMRIEIHMKEMTNMAGKALGKWSSLHNDLKMT